MKIPQPKPASKEQPKISLSIGRGRRLAKRRQALRDNLWPEASRYVWSRLASKGFTTIPRTLPLVMRLIDALAPKGNPSAVYLDLWSRAFDESMVSVRDEEEMAFAAGYDGPRAVRTWREHVDTLVTLNFVRIKEMGNRDVGHVLILDPHLIAAMLHAKGMVPESWWNMFVTRMNEIGADIPAPPDEPLQL